MDIKLDIMVDGKMVIYNLVDELRVEEPCVVQFTQTKTGIIPSFGNLLALSNSGTTQRHDQVHVLYTTTPNDQLRNMYIDMLKEQRANRTGIVMPKDDTIQLVKK